MSCTPDAIIIVSAGMIHEREPGERFPIMLQTSEEIRMGEFAIAVAFATQTSSGEPIMVNPRQLVRTLADALTPLCTAYIQGKASIRDAIMAQIDCAAEDADGLVGALESHGFLRYSGSRERIDGKLGHWRFVAYPRDERRLPAT
jgi:hypothetical protein